MQTQLIHRLSFLCEVGLHYLSLNRRAPSLSGGEAQRIRLARQLGSGLTGVLYVLDEPTIGLDINAKLMIRGLLNRLSNDHGTTLFLTSHDTADIEQVCDRVIVLDKGAIITDSPLKDLKKTYMKKKILTLLVLVGLFGFTATAAQAHPVHAFHGHGGGFHHHHGYYRGGQWYDYDDDYAPGYVAVPGISINFGF